MPSVQSIGGELVVIPALEVDINDLEDDAGRARVHANWEELLAACDMAGRWDAASIIGGFDGNNGTVQLPAGTIYVSKPNITDRAILGLDERHAGITLRGAGREKTVLNDPYTHTSGGEVILAMISRRISEPSTGTFGPSTSSVTVIDPELCSAHQLLYFWNVNPTPGRSLRTRCKITSVSGSTATFTPALTATWSNFRHYQGYSVSGPVNVGDMSAILEDPTLASYFQINDDIMISDGAAVNEVFAEWVRVTNIVDGEIFFAPAVRRSYEDGLTCLLPAPHMSDITVRDLSLAGPIGNTDRIIGYVKYGVRLQFENVDLVRDGADTTGIMALGFVNCARVLVNHFRTPGEITFGVCSDFLLTDLVAKTVYGEEYCLDFQFTNVLIDGQGFYFAGTESGCPCLRMHLDNALFLSYGTTDSGGNSGCVIAEGSRISNVTMLLPRVTDPIYLNEDNLSLTNFSTQSPVHVRGQNIRLNNFSAPTLLMGDDYPPYGPSAGVLLTPLDPDVVGDFTSAGRWLRSLFVQNDGAIAMPKWTTTSGATPPGLVIPSPDAAKVAMTVIGASTQSSDLTQWLNHTSSFLFGIRADGNLKTAKAVAVTLNFDAYKALPIYDSTNALIGYIPIYPEV